MQGPGKYDFFCTWVRERTRAQAVVLIVIDGHKGTGMSAQSYGIDADTLADLLEGAAKDIREGRE